MTKPNPEPSDNIIIKNGKKYKLMSPAILFWKFSNVYAVSNYLIASKEDIKFLKIGDADIQWPALDANGNPIQYRVEVEE